MNKVNTNIMCLKASCKMTVQVKAWTLHQYLVGLLACLILSACVSLLKNKCLTVRNKNITRRDFVVDFTYVTIFGMFLMQGKENLLCSFWIFNNFLILFPLVFFWNCVLWKLYQWSYIFFLVTAVFTFKILKHCHIKNSWSPSQSLCMSWCWYSQTFLTEHPSPARCITVTELIGVLWKVDASGPASVGLFVCSSNPMLALGDGN